MEESTRWIVGIIVTILLALLGWAFNLWRSRHRDWLLSEFASLRRADSKNGKAVENMVAKVEQLEDKQHHTDRAVSVHDEKHRNSEEQFREIKGMIRDIHSTVVPDRKETG